MPQRIPVPGVCRRSLLLGAAAGLVPFAAQSSAVCTPHDLSHRYRARVERSLQVPPNEALIYGGLAETELLGHPEPLHGPQYLLVVDSCPSIQVAFLFWRLLAGHYELVGASPASTGDPVRPGCVATPCGVFPQADVLPPAGARASRVYDFGLRRARRPSGHGFAPLRLQAHSARGRSRALLGTAQSDGRVLLPPSLVAFLDEYRVLDASHADGRTAAGEFVPFAGRHMIVLDSEREDRPDWAAA